MFDIGFAELLIIGIVALLVIGPERLPGAIRTGSAWLNRFRRGFNEIKHEVQQELHNDAVMRELRESGESLRRETEALRQDFTGPLDDFTGPAARRLEKPSEKKLPVPPGENLPENDGDPARERDHEENPDTSR